MIHRLNISVTGAVSEHLHAQVLEFGCSRGAAEREYRITEAGEATNQEEESWPRPPFTQEPHQSTEGIKAPRGDGLKVFVQEGRFRLCTDHIIDRQTRFLSDCLKTGPLTVARQPDRKTLQVKR